MDLKLVITQFRADFKAVFANYRKAGELSAAEAKQQFNEAAQAVQENMHDKDWIEAAAAHFRQICIDIERDRERSVRIATEERDRKWKEREADMKRRYGGRVPA